MVGRTGWSVPDLIATADFLGVTPDALMDDTILSKAEDGYTRTGDDTRAIANGAHLRYFALPDDGYGCPPSDSNREPTT